MSTSINSRRDRSRGRLTTPMDSLVSIYKGGRGPIQTFVMTDGLVDTTVAVYHGAGLTLDTVIAEAADWLPDVDGLPYDDWWTWTITGDVAGEGQVLARVRKNYRTGQVEVEKLAGE